MMKFAISIFFAKFHQPGSSEVTLFALRVKLPPVYYLSNTQVRGISLKCPSQQIEKAFEVKIRTA